MNCSQPAGRTDEGFGAEGGAGGAALKGRAGAATGFISTASFFPPLSVRRLRSTKNATAAKAATAKIPATEPAMAAVFSAGEPPLEEAFELLQLPRLIHSPPTSQVADTEPVNP